MLRRAILAVLALGLPVIALAEPMVMAAASTSRALDAAIGQSGIASVANYGASGMLARQIEQGAPADIFVSANPKWMQYLVEAGMVDASTVSVLMSNRLVLIAPADAPDLVPQDIASRLDGESFVMANPDTAPVGAYGKSALESLGLWGDMGPQLVPMRNTLATVAAVSRAEAALGLVYASDAAGQDGVRVVWEIPEDSHPPIRYLIAPLSDGTDPGAAAPLLDFLLSAKGRDVLEGFGFLAIEEGA